MPSLKESIENNLAVFFLGALVAGFLSGIAAYETTLRIAGRTTISTEAFKSQELELNKARTAQAAQPPIQRYLTIHRVAGNEGNMVRVVARVNNILYAYPADVAFTPISSNMPEQKLPLPWTIDGYTVSFEVQLRDAKNGCRQARNVWFRRKDFVRRVFISLTRLIVREKKCFNIEISPRP